MFNAASLMFKVLARRWMRFAAFAAFALAVGASCAFLGGKLFEEGIEPITVTVIDLDDSVESRLVMHSLNSGETGFVTFTAAGIPEGYSLEEAVNGIIARNDTAAVFVIPKEYAKDVMSGENPPFTVTLNSKKPLSSFLARAYAEAFADMLKAAQSGVYAALDYALEYGDDKQYDQTFTRVNMRFISIVLGRGGMFAVNEVSPVGESVFGHYYFAACFFILSLAALLFVDIIRKTFVYNAQRLALLGVKPVAVALGAYAALLVVFAALCALCAFAGLNLSGADIGAMALSDWGGAAMKWGAAAAALSAFTLFCGVFFRGGQTAVIGVFTVSALWAFVTGGVIPVSMLPGYVGKIGAIAGNYFGAAAMFFLMAAAVLYVKKLRGRK